MELVPVGTRMIPVVAQKHARLRHYLSQEDFQKVVPHPVHPCPGYSKLD